MNVVPIRLGARWIDDGLPVELWSDAGTVGLRLDVAHTSEDRPRTVMEVRRIGRGPMSSSAVLFVDLATGDLRNEIVPDGVLEAPLDLAWLRARLDDELCAALRQRLERRRRAGDLYDWKEGDQPRASLGDRVTFAQVLPADWDLVVTFEGARYALIDSYQLVGNADEKPVAIEIVELATGDSVGHAELHGDVGPTPEPGRMWRCRGPMADRLLMAVRRDPTAGTR